MLGGNELLTYLGLEQAGPRRAGDPEPGLPPWGSGEGEKGLRQEELAAPARFLQRLLELRRSSRILWNSIAVSELLQVVRLSLARPGEQPPFRPYPTSGGCDELAVLIAARKVDGLQEGAYWVSAEKGEGLRYAAPLSEEFAEFERRACPFLGLPIDHPPAALLLLLADWRRLSSRYEHCVFASALMDCGALLQTISLAATACSTNACICACIQPRLIGSWLQLDCREIGHIGTIALGSRLIKGDPVQTPPGDP